MKTTKKMFITIVFVSVFFILFSCVQDNSNVKKVSAKVNIKQKNNMEYLIESRDTSLSIAKNKAFKLAVKDAILTIISNEIFSENNKLIEDNILLNPWEFIKTYEIKDKYDESGMVNIEISIVVDYQKLKESLIQLKILKSEEKKSKNNKDNENQIYNEDYVIKAKEVLKKMNENEKQVLMQYIKQLVYMVYYDENSISIDKEYIKYAVSRVNSFLSKMGMEYVEQEQIIKLKKDHEILSMAVSGKVSELQLIAEKLGSDIYVSVDAHINNRESDGYYFAQVNVILKIYESATGRGLGEAIGVSDELGSQSSLDIAIRAALDDAISKGMKKALELATNKMILAFKDGIRYKIVLLNPQSTKLRIKFEKALKSLKNFKSLKSISATKEEAKYFIYYMGTLDDMEEEIFEIISDIPGFEEFDEVLKRHNTIIFTL